jgi:hypothetical protein
MEARQPKQSDSIPSGLLPAALAVLAAATILMALPAGVAVISILDRQLLDRSQAWLSSGLALASPYIAVARMGLILALVAVVRTTKEDQ